MAYYRPAADPETILDQDFRHRGLRIPARCGRYYDPVRRHYFRTQNLFVMAPECGCPYPNQVLPKEGRYFDTWDRHYYKIGHLFGIEDCRTCADLPFTYNRPFIKW